jgi:hypothetical protein
VKTFLLVVLNFATLVVLQQSYLWSQTPVPKGFAYPESQVTILQKSRVHTSELSGTVTDATGARLAKVLVELLTSNGKERVDAVFTDTQGHFQLLPQAKGNHRLRFSLPGLNSTIVMVTIDAKSKNKLEVIMELSN